MNLEQAIRWNFITLIKKLVSKNYTVGERVDVKDLKPGMIVICGKEGDPHHPSGCWKNGDGEVLPSKILGVDSSGSVTHLVYDSHGDHNDSCSCGDLHHLYVVRYGKTFENIEAGDILLDNDGDETMVLATLPGVVMLSDFNSFDSINEWMLIKELKQRGWTVKQHEEPIQEMTVADVEKLVGKKVKIIKGS